MSIRINKPKKNIRLFPALKYAKIWVKHHQRSDDSMSNKRQKVNADDIDDDELNIESMNDNAKDLIENEVELNRNDYCTNGVGKYSTYYLVLF